MSRAFVKDHEPPQPELPELPLSPHPNHVTLRGLQQLRDRAARVDAELAALDGDDALRRAHLERERRWLKARIQTANVIDPALLPRDRVAFGSCVTVRDEADREARYCIVGEDEAEPEHGLVSWVSPLARALLGARVGDSVVWHRPAGDVEIEVVDVEPAAETPPRA